MKEFIIVMVMFAAFDLIAKANPGIGTLIGVIAIAALVVRVLRGRRAKSAGRQPKRSRRRRRSAPERASRAAGGMFGSWANNKIDPGEQERARRRGIDAEISRLRGLVDLHGQKQYHAEISGKSGDAAYHARKKEEALAEIRRLQGMR